MTAYDQKTSHRWRIAGIAAAVATTAVVGGVAWATDLSALTGGSVQAADPTPSPSTSQSPTDEGPGRKLGHGPGMRGMLGMGGALHGEFVVKKDGGGYQTIATQRGQVTAVSKDSITVKSEDGFSRSYTVTEDTLVNAARDGIDDVKTGNTVNVCAIVADGKASAVSVDDGTVRDAARDHWGLKRGPR